MSRAIDRIADGAAKFQTAVKWPGTDVDVRLHILAPSEQQEADFEADRWFRAAKVDVSSHTLEAWETERTVQMLWRALRDPEDDTPLTKTVVGFRALSVLTIDVRNELVRAYRAFEAEVSPNPELMDMEEIKEFVAALKKKPEEIVSSVTSIAFARRVLLSLAAQP